MQKKGAVFNAADSNQVQGDSIILKSSGKSRKRAIAPWHCVRQSANSC